MKKRGLVIILLMALLMFCTIKTVVAEPEANESQTVSESETTQEPTTEELKNIEDVKFLAIKDQTYTGLAIKPSVKAEDKDAEYEVIYKNNTNVGTATIEIKGTGNYTGTKKLSFKIKAKQISSCSIEKVTNKIYTGKSITPVISIKNGTITLKKNTDYTVTYRNNTNVGTATIEIKGKGNYTGTHKINFHIQKELAKLTFGKITNVEYTGKAMTPDVQIKDGKTVLKKNTDYTLKYKNNNGVGVASVTVTGKGKYVGTKTISFTIVPAKPANLRINRTDKALTITWNTVHGAKTYQVYEYNTKTKKYKSVGTVNTNKFVVKNVKSSTEHTYVVKALNGKYVSANSSAIKAYKVPNKVTITGAKFSSEARVTTTWKSVNSTGYQFLFSTDKNFKNVQPVNLNAKTLSRNVDKVSFKYIYYVKVRGFNKNGNSVSYGNYSNVSKIQLSKDYIKLYSEYTTKYSEGNKNRSINVKLACKAINGKVLAPGQTFSFNSTVGKRTEEKGYKDAHIFSGQSVIEGIGGGVCQVASTIFNTALLANCQIVQRSQHSQSVAYTPRGRDAAIYWGSKDFRFKNTTGQSIKITATASKGRLRIAFYVRGTSNAKAPNVKLNVSKKGKTYTLKRIVNGKVNYTTKSTY
ncbi:hypothetical protein P261_00963 [Lachnospiraceae bacterium TWA4]|nr:hypothetical protein P261_00963 [Lachnospiraceae bacterium TWA4]